jgi:hypothetical protein
LFSCGCFLPLHSLDLYRSSLNSNSTALSIAVGPLLGSNRHAVSGLHCFMLVCLNFCYKMAAFEL